MPKGWFQRLCEVLYNLFVPKKGKPVRFKLFFGAPFPLTSRGVSMSATITVVQQVPVTAQPVDAKGNPTQTTFPTPPAWSVSDPTILSVSPAADGLSAVVTAVGKIGTATVTVSGTPTGATAPITGSATVDVTAAAPVAFTLTFGTAVDQTPAPPPPPPPPPAA